jgi:hypothetical protein
MSRLSRELAELRRLLDALCEETITADQVQRLEDLVCGHPEAEAYYIQYMSLHADLSRRFAVLPAGSDSQGATRSVPNPERQPAEARSGRERVVVRQRRRLVWGSVLALSGLAAGFVVAIVLLRPERSAPVPPSNPGSEQLDGSVAVLLQAPGAVWGQTDFPLGAGTPLLPGRLSLKSGFAHLQFYSGATVLLEGPAEFELISRTEAYCARGKLRALVPPPARGFTIRSPEVDLVDRGTEFGLQVAEGGKTEVHVFAGKVELYEPGRGPEAGVAQELTTGRGVRLNGPGAAQAIASDPNAFLTPEMLAERLTKEFRARHEEWLAAGAALSHDPGLVVYYSFQSPVASSRTLLDGTGDRKPPCDGTVVGCTWVAGRWPGKQGLEFKQVSDRVRFHVPGEFSALTLVAWVRVDALPNRFNSLMMTDGWEARAPHWHISREGRLELGVQGPRGHGGIHYYGPEVFTPQRLGQWVQLAVVYDRAAGRVVHYVDGRPATWESLKLDIPLRLGNAELGNWNLAEHHNPSPVRYFSGCMDEFLLFGRALSDEEIHKLFTDGQPPA